MTSRLLLRLLLCANPSCQALSLLRHVVCVALSRAATAQSALAGTLHQQQNAMSTSTTTTDSREQLVAAAAAAGENKGDPNAPTGRMVAKNDPARDQVDASTHNPEAEAAVTLTADSFEGAPETGMNHLPVCDGTGAGGGCVAAARPTHDDNLPTECPPGYACADES